MSWLLIACLQHTFNCVPVLGPFHNELECLRVRDAYSTQDMRAGNYRREFRCERI